MAVDFTDLFDGPGAIRIRNAARGKRGSKLRPGDRYDSDEDLEMTNYDDDDDIEEQKNLTRRRNLKKKGSGRFGNSKRRDTRHGHDYEDILSTDPSEEELQGRRRVRQQNPYSLTTV